MSGYVRLYGPDYGPNIEIPIMSTRMIMMLKALDNGGIIELMEVMYSFAEIDFELSDPYRAGGNKKSIRGSMEVMLKDRADGKLHALDLLKSMHIDVIRACIDNTLGHWYKTSTQFRTLFHEVGMCSGVYGYTMLVKGDSGEFLSSNQIKVLSKKIEAYAKSAGVRGNSEAVEIDTAFGGADFDQVRTRNGERLWLNSACTPGYHNKTIILSSRLHDRTKIDAVGTSPQLQSPIGVGYSSDLKSRTGNYGINPHINTVTRTWGLIRSTLQIMKVDVVPVTFVLLKIWDDKYRALGEILMTMLASSLVEDGGLNPKQAGTHLGPLIMDRYGDEEEAVFIQKPWLAENEIATGAELEKRIEILSHLDGSRRDNIDAMQKETEDRLREIEDGLKAEEELLAKTGAVLDERKARLSTTLANLEEENRAMEDQLNFLDELAAWGGSV